MVSLEQLEAVDLLLWLGTTERAAQLARTNQSTVSRRSRAGLQTLGINLLRCGDGWSFRGDTRLLELERIVHQRARWLGRHPLRLQVPFWTRSAALRCLPAGWCANPIAATPVCQNPVQLLRERVIDACLIAPTQVPATSSEILLLDLYSRPIELTVFAGRSTASVGDGIGRRSDRSQKSSQLLRLVPFLPRSCMDRSRDWFATLLSVDSFDRHQVLDGDSVAFLTPEMRQAQDLPWRVAAGFEPFPYVERLAVLSENAHEAALQRLQDKLLELFGQIDCRGTQGCLGSTPASPSQQMASAAN